MKGGSTSKLRAELARWMLRLSHKAVPMVKRRFNLRGIDLFVPEGIFNPAFTFSTELMMEYIGKVGAEGKALEIGCGSGALSIFIAKRFSVEAHCFDISPLSITTESTIWSSPTLHTCPSTLSITWISTGAGEGMKSS